MSNPTPEQRHDTSENEVAVDDHQEQTDNSDDARDSEVINNLFSSFINQYFFYCYSKVLLIFFCNSRGQSSLMITCDDGWTRLIVTFMN